MFGIKRKKIFSIIVPVYNGKKTLERTLASFISNKDYIKDVIIVDDCSTDGTKSIVDKWIGYKFFSIKYSKNESNVGPGSSRKKGIELANSEWITFVDADDCLTAGCLKYVYENIVDNKDLVILHTQSIFYESGSFNPDTIAHSDTSCGGNFYKRKYLVDNNLYPHDTLPLVEDQYFNEKIMYYLDYCEKSDSDMIGRFDYPVYEVHHDTDQGYSYAIRNWEEYCIKYRLLYKQYLVNDYFDIASENEESGLYAFLVIDYIMNFIFAFYLATGLQYDEDVNYDFEDEENVELFRDAMKFYLKTFGRSTKDFIDYYNNEKESVNEIIDAARITLGLDIDEEYSFVEFVKNLL